MPIRTHAELIHQMNSLQVSPSCLAIWGLGQMGVALKGSDGRLIYIDPVLTNVVAEKIPAAANKFVRAFPAPINPSEITNASLVLCTHEHLDHTDPLTLGPLAKASPQAKVITTGWCDDLLDEAEIESERRIVPPAEQALDFEGIRITAIPVGHYQVEFDPRRGYRYFSFLVEWNGVVFYHSGDFVIDPGYLERMHAHPTADLALVAANGRDAYREANDCVGNLMPSEAVWLAQELGWDTILPGHNDLFAWNTISTGLLPDAIQRSHPRQRFHILQPGELYYYIR